MTEPSAYVIWRALNIDEKYYFFFTIEIFQCGFFLDQITPLRTNLEVSFYSGDIK